MPLSSAKVHPPRKARHRLLFRFEQASGLLMLGAMVLALVVANSPLADLYRLIHHLPVHLRVGPLVIERPLVQWINEGLMVFFFLVVGLEIKRQLLEGHLSTAKEAALPAFAALGGMALPAAIYVLINRNHPQLLGGWAIPTATDIVLALGILSLLGPRVPVSLRVFLTALAVFDDVGAVLIIGLFYGESPALVPLLLTAAGTAGLIGLNALGVTRALPYALLGVFLWVAMLKSGIQAALAGVIIGFAVPLRVRSGRGPSPLREAERRLHPWAVLGVVPLFAFFNAGIALSGAAMDGLLSPLSLGVVTGLFVGKQMGVLGGAWVAVRLGLGSLPRSVGWGELYGAALLAGIGFTMSLFVASLAFATPELAGSARLAILIGSALSAVTGLVVLHAVLPPRR